MRDVPADVVARAKMLMAHGLSMHEAARGLNVMATDLDQAIWRYLGVPRENMVAAGRQFYRPDF